MYHSAPSVPDFEVGPYDYAAWPQQAEVAKYTESRLPFLQLAVGPDTAHPYQPGKRPNRANPRPMDEHCAAVNCAELPVLERRFPDMRGELRIAAGVIIYMAGEVHPITVFEDHNFIVWLPEGGSGNAGLERTGIIDYVAHRVPYRTNVLGSESTADRTLVATWRQLMARGIIYSIRRTFTLQERLEKAEVVDLRRRAARIAARASLAEYCLTFQASMAEKYAMVA